MDDHAHASFFLRLGLAFSFAYAAVSGFMAPEMWIGFLPQWAGAIASPRTLLVVFGAYELLLAGFLVMGIRRFETAILAGLTLVAITAANFGVFDVTFRDVSLALAALALAILEYGKRKNSAI